jgi:hypothetical protein
MHRFNDRFASGDSASIITYGARALSLREYVVDGKVNNIGIHHAHKKQVETLHFHFIA